MKSWKFQALIGLLGLLGLACGESADAEDGADRSGTVVDTPAGGEGVDSPYAYLREGGVATSEQASVWAALPYSSITLERYGCYGTCPVYSVEFTRGRGGEAGAAVYDGGMFVDRIGVYAGEIDIFSYGQLCQLLDELGFQDFEENYAAQWTDDSTVVVQAASAVGMHRVQDYGRQGPPELFALQLAIDAVADRIEWTEQ